jgi:PAS domain S-box-containing protein
MIVVIFGNLSQLDNLEATTNARALAVPAFGRDKNMPKAKILLVDDQPANLLALEAILEGLGENLVKAQSGEEALRLVDEEVAVVLLDVQMHGLDGFETAKLIRGREQTRHTPIIFLTAYDDNRLSNEQAYALGAVDYLIKPLVPVMLRAKVAGFVELFKKTHEITQQAEQLRRLEREEYEQKFADFAEAVMANMGEGLYSVDAQGLVTYVNPTAERLFGWTSAELLGCKMHEVTHYKHPDGSPFPIEECAGMQVLHKGTILTDYEDVFIRKDGSFFPVIYSSSPIRSEGNTVGLVVVFRDITERKRVEDSLRESEQRLTSLFDSSNDAIVSKSLEGVIQSWNPAAERLFGYTAAEAVGRPITMLIPRDRIDEEDRIITRLRAGERVEHFDTVRLRSDGQPVEVSLTISPIRDATGRIVGASKIARDITDRKRLEAELQGADRRKNEFLAMLAHELRNPLAPICNAVQILKQKRSDASAVHSATQLLERQVGQMVGMVDDLLDVSRISRGKIELRRRRIELASAVHHAVEAARALVQCMEHELTVTLPPQPVYLYADPTRLAQVVGNLLNNACKFTNKGGRIALIVEVASREREPPEAIIRVRDNGIGIAADHLHRIFDMFTQVDTSLERSVGGLGIGLALVKNLVEMHGGTIEAHSTGKGHGCEFVVRLPTLVDTSDPPESEPAGGAPTTATTPRRILVVDDNRDSAASLALLLKMSGNETHTAHDGVKAVEAAATYRPDVVLLDIGLPNLNGYDACRRIREQPWGKDMVVIALTGWGQDDERRKSKEAGFNGHLVKPVDLAALKAMMDTPPEQNN